jgi:hypothetical protein
LTVADVVMMSGPSCGTAVVAAARLSLLLLPDSEPAGVLCPLVTAALGIGVVITGGVVAAAAAAAAAAVVLVVILESKLPSSEWRKPVGSGEVSMAGSCPANPDSEWPRRLLGRWSSSGFRARIGAISSCSPSAMAVVSLVSIFLAVDIVNNDRVLREACGGKKALWLRLADVA